MGGLRIYIQKQIPREKETTVQKKQSLWGGLSVALHRLCWPAVKKKKRRRRRRREKTAVFWILWRWESKCCEPLIHISGGALVLMQMAHGEVQLNTCSGFWKRDSEASGKLTFTLWRRRCFSFDASGLFLKVWSRNGGMQRCSLFCFARWC